jgi:hypothetical protein
LHVCSPKNVTVPGSNNPSKIYKVLFLVI